MADGCSHSLFIVTPQRWWDPSQFPRRLLAWTGNNANRLMAASSWWLLPNSRLLQTLDSSPSVARAFPHSHGPASASCTIMVVSTLASRRGGWPSSVSSPPPNPPSHTPARIEADVAKNASRTVIMGSALGSWQLQTPRYQIHHGSRATFEPAPDAYHCPSYGVPQHFVSRQTCLDQRPSSNLGRGPRPCAAACPTRGFPHAKFVTGLVQTQHQKGSKEESHNGIPVPSYGAMEGTKRQDFRTSGLQD